MTMAEKVEKERLDVLLVQQGAGEGVYHGRECIR